MRCGSATSTATCTTRAATWLRQREIESDGAILVRPDRFIAWRQPTAADDPRGALAGALSQILARPVTAPVATAV